MAKYKNNIVGGLLYDRKLPPPLYELGEIQALKQENRELKEQLDSIGTVYGGSFLGKILTAGEYVEVAQVEVPPGTYLLVGSAQINVSSDNIFALLLENNICVRFNGGGGGGASASIVKKTDTSKIFRMKMYKPQIETTVKSSGVYFQAIKIK